MRKSVALALIKLAYRINPPTVTEVPWLPRIFGPDGRGFATATNGQIGELTSYEAQQLAARRESRGWN